jgi:hypothetical protein
VKAGVSQPRSQTGVVEFGAFALLGKWFAETAEDAAKWGEFLRDAADVTVVRARIADSVLDVLERWPKLDGIGPARWVDPSQLDMFNEALEWIKW